MYIVIYHLKEYVMIFQKNIKLLKCSSNCRFYTSSPGIYLTPLVHIIKCKKVHFVKNVSYINFNTNPTIYILTSY